VGQEGGWLLMVMYRLYVYIRSIDPDLKLQKYCILPYQYMAPNVVDMTIAIL